MVDPFVFLDSLPVWDGTRRFDLETITKLAQCFGNPQDRIPSIHITGTNGKGSVGAFLTAMIRAAGYNVGHYASPHLSHITERCLINGRPVATESYAETLQEVIKTAEREGLRPSYFEYTTMVAFLEFLHLGVDWMVIEVGLGGRLDATNIMKTPKASVITSIGYDHMQVLGNSLEEIAREKAGIIKTDTPVFIGNVPEKIFYIIQDIAIAQGTKLISKLNQSDMGLNAETEVPFEFSNLALPGKHQIENSKLAIQVAQYLGLNNQIISRGLATARWPGRLELLQSTGEEDLLPVSVLLDAAHNSDGIDCLVEYLFDLAKEKKITKLIFLIGIYQRKDWQQMLLILKSLNQDFQHFSIATKWIFTSLDSFSVSGTLLVKEFGMGQVIDNPEQAITSILEDCRCQNHEKSLVVITGSLALIGAIRPLLTNKEVCSISEEFIEY